MIKAARKLARAAWEQGLFFPLENPLRRGMLTLAVVVVVVVAVVVNELALGRAGAVRACGRAGGREGSGVEASTVDSSGRRVVLFFQVV